jgi:hypothetical protein
MFFLAAFIEAFWSPITALPFHVKITAGIAGWVVFAVYFLLAGRARAAG